MQHVLNRAEMKNPPGFRIKPADSKEKQHYQGNYNKLLAEMK